MVFDLSVDAGQNARRMVKMIRNWWRGKPVPVKVEKFPGGISIDGGYRVRPWLARVLLTVWHWLQKDWMAKVGFVLTAIGFLITLKSCRPFRILP